MRDTAEVQCPTCWETVELVLDLSGGSTAYTEDCPVCCNPMRISLTVDEDRGFAVEVEAES